MQRKSRAFFFQKISPPEANCSKNLKGLCAFGKWYQAIAAPDFLASSPVTQDITDR